MYLAASCALRQSCVLVGVAAFIGEAGRGAASLETEAISEAVEARSWIFLERGGRLESRVGSNGCLRRPSLGIRSFCTSGGMERRVDIWVARSRMVAVEGKVSEVGLPWWVIVMVVSESEGVGSSGKGAGSWGGESMGMLGCSMGSRARR